MPVGVIALLGVAGVAFIAIVVLAAMEGRTLAQRDRYRGRLSGIAALLESMRL